MEHTRDWADPQTHVRSRKSKSVGEIPDFPPELIDGILKRLPVKSLLKFRCVSKSWLSLISSPEFIKIHLNFSTNNPSFTNHRIMHTIDHPISPLRHCSLYSLVFEHETVASITDYPMKGPDREVLVAGSCNGVICLVVDENDIFLWNPSIRSSKKLPPLAVEMKDLIVPGMREGFFRSCSFGFYECDDDYKVVAIFGVLRKYGVPESRINIYSLKTDSWKTIKDFKTGVLLDYSGRYASGKLHFTTTLGRNSEFKWNIVSIDLRSEVCDMVEQPNYGEGSSVKLLGVLGGCLCVLSNYRKIRGDVWVLKEYNVKESWTKVFSIPYTNDPCASLYKHPLLMLPNGEILLVFGMHFVVYNPKDDTCRRLETTNAKYFIAANIYVESLISL